VRQAGESGTDAARRQRSGERLTAYRSNVENEMPVPAPVAGPPPRTPSRIAAVAHVAAATTLLLAPLAGCGAGQVAHTAEIQSVVDGATARVGDIAILDAQFLFTGPVPGDEVYPVGADAPLHLTIVNSGETPDRLVRVSSPIAASGIVMGPTTVPANGSLTAGQVGPVAGIESAQEDEAVIGLVELSTPIRSGLTYPVVFGFERAGDVVIPVPVDTPGVPRLVPFDAD
jgi:hypothetical protein